MSPCYTLPTSLCTTTIGLMNYTDTMVTKAIVIAYFTTMIYGAIINDNEFEITE